MLLSVAPRSMGCVPCMVHGLCALHVVQCLLSGLRLGDSVLLKNERMSANRCVAPACSGRDCQESCIFDVVWYLAWLTR